MSSNNENQHNVQGEAFEPVLNDDLTPSISLKQNSLFQKLTPKVVIGIIAFIVFGALSIALTVSSIQNANNEEIIISDKALEETNNAIKINSNEVSLSQKIHEVNNKSNTIDISNNELKDVESEIDPYANAFNEEVDDEELYALIRGGVNNVIVGKIHEEVSFEKNQNNVQSFYNSNSFINNDSGLNNGSKIDSNLNANYSKVTYDDTLTPEYKSNVVSQVGYVNNNGIIEPVSNGNRELIEDELLYKKANVDTSLIKIDSSYVINELTNIDCILIQKIDSTYSGNVSCQVSSDVYTNGGQVAIPVGSIIYGKYASGTINGGSNRLLISWDRVKTTYGLEFGLTNSLGADNLGTVGVAGNRNSQFFARFGQALGISYIGDLSSILERKVNDKLGLSQVQEVINPVTGAKYQSPYSSNSKNVIAGIAEQLMKENIILPSIQIPQGTLINVLLNKDINLSKFKKYIYDFNVDKHAVDSVYN